MNDTTSTPDDPDRPDHDGRGTVVTGEQTITDRNGSGGETVNGSPAAGSGASAPDPTASAPVPAAAPRPEVNGGSGPAEQAPPRPSMQKAAGTTAPPPPPERGSAAVSGAVAAEAPTAQMRLPSGGAGDAPTANAPRPPERGPSPTPGPAPTPGPVPAPGPVPGPGPEADAPPPWQRVPGQDRTQNGQNVPAPRPAAGGLLDDGPTAFLEAPPRPADPGAAAQEHERGSTWTATGSGHSRPPRQAALQLKRLDPWSVLKLALVLALVLFFIWMDAVGVLYGVLDGIGVWDRLNGTYADLVSGEAPTGTPLISATNVLVLAGVVGAINSLLFAVAITVGAFVYNVSADLVGGIEVTLSERD